MPTWVGYVIAVLVGYWLATVVKVVMIAKRRAREGPLDYLVNLDTFVPARRPWRGGVVPPPPPTKPQQFAAWLSLHQQCGGLRTWKIVRDGVHRVTCPCGDSFVTTVQPTPGPVVFGPDAS